MSKNSLNEHGAAAETAQSRFLVLLVTTRCNLSCRYCSMDAGNSGEDMPIKTALEAIDVFLAGCGPSVVQFSGGEPLLAYGLIREIVRLRPWGNLRFALQTNGVMLDEEKLLFLARNGVGLGVSLDGVPAVNERHRGETRQVLRALELTERLGIGVNLTVVLTKNSVARLPEFLMLCARLRTVRTINLDLLRQVGRATMSDDMPTCEQMEAVVPQISRTLDFINRWRRPQLNVREFDQIGSRLSSRKSTRYCLGAQGAYAVVTPCGDVYPCASFLGRSEYLVGSVKDLRPIKLQELTADWGLPETCRSCPARFACRGGCPARRIAACQNVHHKHEEDCALRWAIYQNKIRHLTAVPAR